MHRLLAAFIVSISIAGCTGAAELSSGTTAMEADSSAVAISPPSTSTTTSTSTSTSTSSTTTSTTLPALDRSRSGSRMQADIAALVGLGVRESGSAAEDAAFDHIRDVLGEIGLEAQSESFPLPNDKTSQNVWTIIGDGSVQVLLGAHVDSKPPSPGADDNGSGTVVLLELARRLADQSVRNVEVTVVFFGAEEVLIGFGRNDHHYGSRHMAERLSDSGDLPDLMVSADMIGVGEALVGAIYRDTDPAAAGLLAAAADLNGLELLVLERGDISDHEAFARKGVPAVFMWRPDNPDYHLESDVSVRTDALLEDLHVLEAFLELASETD